MTTLTICALANSSTTDLERFFTSIHGCSDQVLIGNLSNSPEIEEFAKSRGAQVFSFGNTKDFSEARNKLLDLATSEWVMVMDTHESISNPNLRNLKSFLSETDHDVFVMTICNYTNQKGLMGWRPSPNPEYEGYIPAKQARVFRNNASIRFSYPVHETIQPSLVGKRFVVKEIEDIVFHNFRYHEQLEDFYFLLKRLHKDQPKDSKIAYDLGMCYLRRGRLLSAKKLMNQVAKANPRYRNVLTNLANITLKEGDEYEAAKLFFKAIEANPKDLSAYHNLGQLFRKSQKYDKAEYLFQKALTVQPQEPRLIIALMHVYQEQGKVDKAKSLLERGLVLMPKNKMLEHALAKISE